MLAAAVMSAFTRCARYCYALILYYAIDMRRFSLLTLRYATLPPVAIIYYVALHICYAICHAAACRVC